MNQSLNNGGESANQATQSADQSANNTVETLTRWYSNW